MNNLTMSILGFPAVNRDLSVEIREPLTQQVIRTVKPFLDGTVRVPQITPGSYEISVKHPNLNLPVLTRPIRILPIGDTSVSIVIDPSKFRNTPIEDIPDANLEPVRALSDSVAESVTSLAEKRPGEAILAEDWNRMASSIRDLAGAVSQLTRLVAPQGHDHPEFVRKFDELSENFETLLDTLSKTLTDLQRQIQTQRLRRHIEGVLDRAGINPADARGQEFLGIVNNLEAKVTATPTEFGRDVRLAGVQLSTKLEQLIQQRVDDPEFSTSDPVRTLGEAVDLAKTQRSTTYDSELVHLRRETAKFGVGGVRLNLGG
jgi:hypothetical protein